MQDDILVDVCKSAKQIFQSETDFENTWIRYLEDADGLYWFHNSHWLVWDLNPKKIFQRSLRIFLKNQNFRLEILKFFHEFTIMPLKNDVILTFLSFQFWAIVIFKSKLQIKLLDSNRLQSLNISTQFIKIFRISKFSIFCLDFFELSI